MTPTLRNRNSMIGVADSLNSDENADDMQIEAASTLAGATPIQDFYSDAKIFITGATGFVGKVLVEKLLRSCHNIDTVYYLVRTKRGDPVTLRHEKLLVSTVFDRIRKEKPEVLKKLVPISGDVSEIDLGLSPQDRLMLQQNVNIAFHSAATVRFNENIADAFASNTAATIKVLDLCKGIKSLKALVYVSTAYSNSDKPEVREEVYPAPADIEKVLEVCKIQEEREQENATKKILAGHPNTYTMTKALAETIVDQHAKDIPVCIVRPSIVTGALKEPEPGWIDNFTAISGIMVEVGRGTLKSIICEETNNMDAIPVDLVVNTLITSAWRTHVQRCSGNDKATVYNCTSGKLNPVSWHDFGRMTEKHFLAYPSKYVTFYPGFSFRTNLFTHWFITLFYQILPAIMIDTFFFCTGKRVYMLSLVKKFIEACHDGIFFSLRGWVFHCDNIVALQEAVSRESNDAADFPLDVRTIHWDSYVKDYVIGLRKIALRDSLASLPAARRKLNRIYWMSTLSLYTFYAFCFNMAYLIISWYL